MWGKILAKKTTFVIYFVLKGFPYKDQIYEFLLYWFHLAYFEHVTFSILWVISFFLKTEYAFWRHEVGCSHFNAEIPLNLSISLVVDCLVIMFYIAEQMMVLMNARFLLYIDETLSITWRPGWMMRVSIQAQTWSLCWLATKGWLAQQLTLPCLWLKDAGNSKHGNTTAFAVLQWACCVVTLSGQR